MQELIYPVLQYTDKYIIGSIQKPKNLLVVGAKNIEEGCFHNAIIIDSSGAKYRVLSANIARLTWDPWNVFFRYRTVWVELELSDKECLSLDEIKKEIFDLLKKNKKWYKRYGETEKILYKKFEDIKTIKELINKISIYP